MKIKGGYYLKARKIQESEIAHAPPCTREVWDWLIMTANYKDNKHIKRGQCLVRIKDIQEGLSWHIGYRKEKYSKSQCENALNTLRKTTMIATTKTTRGMVVEVLNYNTYQTPSNYEDNSEDNSEGNKKTTMTRHYKERRVKNVKKDNNKPLCVFEYWQEVMEHPNAKPTRERLTKIAARLKEGYSVEDLKKAIDGCLASSHHMGDNDQGKRYDSIGLIFRNGDKVEQFMGYLTTKPQKKEAVVDWKTGASAKLDQYREESEKNPVCKDRREESKKLISDLAEKKKL